MDTNKPILVENEYDDGVVCFGPVTEDQLNRYKRLPRHTVLPSDFKLSQSFFKQDENKKNDQSTVLDESNDNTTCVNNSINTTSSANNFDEEKEIESMKLKQSFPEDSNSTFSSPCFSKCISNAKLIDTEVINRYIRMGSTSSSDSSLSEDQNKSTFEDKTINLTDAQEIESIQDNDVFDETSTCEYSSISNVIEQRASSRQQNVLDNAINVCTLVHCSQKDDADLSICSDLEYEDVMETSIVADEYCVTPGKQRLFDLRATKQSLHARALVASAPFMDRIEETITPILPKVLNSSVILNEISESVKSEIKEKLNFSSGTEICHDASTEHLNQTSNENLFETSKFVDESVRESLVSNNLNNIASVNKSVDTTFDETINTDQLSTDSGDVNINKSLIKTEQIENSLNDTVPKSDNEQSINIKTIIDIPTGVDDHYGKNLIVAELDTKSSNTGAEDKIFDETMYTNKLSTNRNMDLNRSLNEIDHIQTSLKDTKQNFDGEKLICVLSNTVIPTPVKNYQNDEFSIAMEVDIKSTNTSYVDSEFDETMYTNKPSTDNGSMDLNRSLNETNAEYTLNDTKQIFDEADEEFSVAMEVDNKSTNTSCVVKEIDETAYTHKLSFNNQNTDLNKSLNDSEQNDDEKSTYIMSNIAIPTLGLTDGNDKEENSIVTEVDIKSIDTSVVNKIFDETYTQKLSINNQNMDLNKSLNETNIENTLNNTEYKFDDENAMNIMPNMSMPISNVKGHSIEEENSIVTEVDIKSIDTSVVNKMFDETNIENTLNNTEHKFDDEKAMNIMPNMSMPISNVKGHSIEEENSIVTEVDIKSIDTSVVNKIFDETYTQELSINNQNMDLNKSLNETNIENTLNNTEHKFDDEKAMNIMPNMSMPISNVKGHSIEEENSIVTEVDIKSIDTSVVNKIFDETYTQELSINNQNMDLNKSLNETNIENTLNDIEHEFNDEKAMNIMPNMAIPTSDVKGPINEEFSVAMEVDTISTYTSTLDKELNETIYANKLVSNDQSIVLNKSLNDTEYKFDDEKSMNVMSIMDVPTSDVNDHNDKENSIATKIDIKSINTSIVDKIFDESILINANKLLTDSRTINCNKSLTETGSTSNITEHKLMNNIQNTSVSEINNFDENSVLNKLDKSIFINTINSDTSFVGINEVNITCNTSLEDPSCMMGKYLDFEQAVNEMCNNISSASCPDGKSNQPKEISDDETLEHLIEQTLSDTFNVAKVNENFLNYDGPKLSIIIEDKSLETSSNNMEQREDFVNSNNDVPITLKSESTVNEVKPIELLNKSTDFSIQIEANETKYNGSPMFSGELSKIELDTYTEINKNLNIPKDVNEIHSIQNTSDENNLNPTANQIITDIPNSTDVKLISDTEKTHKNLTNQDELLNNDNQELDATKNIDSSLKEFINLEQMFNFGSNKKEKQVEYKTPKTQKLLDFSIVQQTPTFDNQAKKQKVLNFSIIDPTPILKSAQQKHPNENVINNDSLIHFNSVDDQMWNSKIVIKNEVDFKDFLNSSNDSLSNNLSTNTSNSNNSSFDRTVTDSELNHVEPLMLINRQIASGEPSNFLNQTIEQSESKQKMFYGEHCVAEANSNEQAIVDFSIIGPGILEKFESKKKTDITSVESDRNVSNLIEMSLVTKSDEQSIILSENPIISDNRSEKSMHSSSDKINSTALHLEESSFLHNNTELLTDIQMNDESLLVESPEKSSIVDSFHSIELDHVQEDNKRKMETTQEYDNNEKKMKVEPETLKTPISMLYKIKNMFRSSEKQPSCLNNTKENNFKSNKCYQKLNFNKFEENNDDFTKPIIFKKSEVIVKNSKIPCKVIDRSLAKNDECNSSSLSSLNDSIQQKKTIPKLLGVPVLSDVSNSSNRKCPESRIPSKFHK